MADNVCHKCGKSFAKPTLLRRHEQRKTPCAPILELEDLPEGTRTDPDLDKKKCKFCGRVFANYVSMRRHVRSTCKIAPNERNGDTGMEILFQHTIRQQQAQIDRQQAQIDELTALVAKPTNSGVVISANDHGQVNVDARVQQQVVVNVFGAEGVEHITVDAIRHILQEAVSASETPARMAEAALLKTALLVYSDPEHPENLTCYLPNQRGDSALVHVPRADGTTGWEVQPVPVVLPKMGKKSVDALFDNQPFEDAEAYGPLLRELLENESRYVGGEKTLRPVLVRNKDLLQRVLETLPMAGKADNVSDTVLDNVSASDTVLDAVPDTV